jgi:hypothetical protein
MKLRLAVEHRQEANFAFAVASLRFIYRLPVVGQLSADRGVACLLGSLVGKRILHLCERPQNRLSIGQQRGVLVGAGGVDLRRQTASRVEGLSSAQSNLPCEARGLERVMERTGREAEV